jgi:hypothetical protein
MFFRLSRDALQNAKQTSPATRHADAWEERRYSSYSFLTSALNGGEWSASHPDRALLLRAGLDTEARGQILCFETRSPGRPVRRQTLY